MVPVRPPRCLFFLIGHRGATSGSLPRITILRPIAIGALGFPLDPAGVCRILRPHRHNAIGMKLHAGVYADHWDRLAHAQEASTGYVLLFAERFGIVVAYDVGDASAWSWSAHAVADPHVGLPLLPPGQRNWPRCGSTVVTLVNKALEYVAQRAHRAGIPLPRSIADARAQFPSVESVDQLLNAGASAAGPLAMTLAVEACDPCHAFAYAAPPIDNRGLAVAGLYHAPTADAVLTHLEALAMARSRSSGHHL